MAATSKVGDSIFIGYTFTKRNDETEWVPEVTISDEIDNVFATVYIREPDLIEVISLLTSKLQKAKKELAKNPNF